MELGYSSSATYSLQQYSQAYEHNVTRVRLADDELQNAYNSLSAEVLNEYDNYESAEYKAYIKRDMSLVDTEHGMNTSEKIIADFEPDADVNEGDLLIFETRLYDIVRVQKDYMAGFCFSEAECRLSGKVLT